MIKKLLVPLLSLLLLLALGGGGFLFWKYTQAQSEINKLAHKQEETAKANKKLIEEVGKIFELPVDEEPTIATVTDKDKLKSQQFFSKAENGDQVLLYTKSARAILFRPSLGKVIDVTTLNINDSKQGTESAKPANLRIALLNGTTTPGLTNAAAKKLASVSGTVVTQKGNAKSTTYTKTIVVNVNNVSKSNLDVIASAVGGSVDSLPAGEEKPDADVLVILATAAN